MMLSNGIKKWKYLDLLKLNNTGYHLISKPVIAKSVSQQSPSQTLNCHKYINYVIILYYIFLVIFFKSLYLHKLIQKILRAFNSKVFWLKTQ